MQDHLSLVSIIMPCYNAAAYLRQAINSVLCQSYSQFELIIVNDGSTDDSENIISQFTDIRIRYFYQQNRGQCFASNFGLSQAKGDYIKFLDADDLINPEHIEAMLKVLGKNQSSLASCAWAAFYGDDVKSARFVPEANWKDMEPLEWIKTSLSELYDMMPAWRWLIPRALIAECGGWDERLSLNNDFEFSVRLLLSANAVYFAPEAKLFYRSGQSDSLSGRHSEKAYTAAFLSAKLGCTQLLKKENSAAMRLLCANKYSFWLYQVYPFYPTLTRELEKEIKLLGGTNRKIDESPLMHTLQKWAGWKTARRLKLLFYRIGYQQYLLRLKKKLFPPSISRN